MIKLLHTGDVHLDSPFSGLSADAAEARRRESRAVFTSMMTYARGNVDLILIAGDLLDTSYVTQSTAKFLSDEFDKVGCPVFISPGNHDPYSPDGIWSKITLPDNVHVFNSDVLQKFSVDSLGVDVYGYAFTSKSLRESPLGTGTVADRSKINLICAHADMSSPISEYAPLSVPMLERFGADYTALGHIHNAEDYMGSAGKCTYAYCGCPEGRSFDECGEKYALSVEIDKPSDEANVKVRKIQFSQRKYETVTVNADGAVSMGDIISAARSALGTEDPTAAVRFRLTGSVSPSLVISKKEFTAAFPKLFYADVKDETLPLWDSGYLKNDMTVRGEFYRMIEPQLGSADERERRVAIRALRYVMAAMNGESISDI